MVHGAPVPLRVVSRFAIASRDCRRHRPAPRGITWRKAVRLFREARGRGSRHLLCTGVRYYGHSMPVAMCDPDVVGGRVAPCYSDGVSRLCAWRDHVGEACAERERSCRFLRRLPRSVTTKGICEENRTRCIRSAESGEALLQPQRDRLVPVLRPWPMPTLPNPSELAKVVRPSCVP